ncbi:MAG: biotin/lipoyl-containing protein, partial [Phycisphaerales bacterium]
MAIELTMPRLSDTMESGTIIKWNVKEGDPVSAGDVVADVETDKATMEMQVYDDGKVSRIVVPEGKTVAVGTLIAVIDDGSGESTATKTDPVAAVPAQTPVSSASAPAS